MPEELRAEAVHQFPRVYKLAVPQVPGSQTLSLERAKAGIVVEVETRLFGARYSVLTSETRDSLPIRGDESDQEVSIIVDDEPEGSHTWEHQPSGEAWQVTFTPEPHLVVFVSTTENPPPTEVRLTRTTINEELPASLRQ